MAWRIQFCLDSFSGAKDPAHSERALSIMLNALAAINLSYLRAHPDTPLLYESGVRYQRERPERKLKTQGSLWVEEGTGELFRDIPEVLKHKGGDCEDLVAWRVAELIFRHNHHAIPTFRWQERRLGSMLYHILVNHPDGTIEDPSRILGMQ